MKIEIKNRWNESVLFSVEASSMKIALEAAVKQGANLEGADLKGAYLEGADLKRAYLEGADLDNVKEDFLKVLDAAPSEVPGLRKAMIDGKINGSQYQGECACLVGTIANVKKCSYQELPGLKPDSSRPAERWFLMFRPGHTPEKHGGMKITLDWLQEWQDKQVKIK